ncbi:MAG TPA: AIR synthase related protein, partial [Candidatus Ozemobacteraceae bacterium]|nr:AIR synthase related protein [Candidatus Ozemobacteraceae bacterium]
MEKIEQLREFAFISQLTRNLRRNPDQVNKCHEADAELIRQTDGSFLAATVDTLYEEYHLGLIRDPRTLGWTVIMQSLSDLAAVAADPIGVLLSVTLPRDVHPDWA